MNRLARTIETYINGNITIAKNEYEYKTPKPLHIVECSNIFGIRTTVKILKKLGIKDLIIINAFYDYKQENLDEVKQILLNNFY